MTLVSRHAAFGVVAMLSIAMPARAQVAGAPGTPGAEEQPAAPLPAGPRSVEGRIVRLTPAGERGVAGVMATLHRVGPDRSGPLDSTRTGADGSFRFRYVPTGSGDALYFVSASYGGIAYFGTPLRALRVRGDDAIITVFDTTSAPLPLHVRGRHVIVSSSSSDERREVLEVFELSNDSSLTRVGGRADSATFRIALPEGAREFAGGQGDVPPEAIALVGGAAEVYAPFAPGIKQLSFRYVLPRAAFPLTIPVGAATEVLEVLLEDSTGTADGAGLARQGPVTASGRTFVRWLGEDVPATGVVRVDFPAAAANPRIPQFALFAAGLAALMLFALRTVARRRAPGATAAEADPERLAQRIAALDAAFERRRAPDDAARVAYEEERERLKRELTDALARRDTRG